MRYFNRSILLLSIALASGATQASEFRYRYNLSESVPYNWQGAETVFEEWKDVGTFYGCTNWSPSTASIGKGLSFTQTATDCKLNQERLAHPQRVDQRTGLVEDVPDAAYIDKRTIDDTQDRDAIGILENWMSYDPTYTSWTDTNSLYGCTSWSPDPAIYTASTQFTQKSDLCKTDQERLRQDREQEHYTLEIRDSGSPVVEQQTLTKQSATRPYSVVLGNWTDASAKYACSDWSPDPSTVGKSVAFTQSATDCKLDQKRTRDESYVDHKTGVKNTVAKTDEARTLSKQANTRPAIGTQENWGDTTPVYSAWTNTPGKITYSCSNWSPAGSTKSTSATFEQTATDCKTDQTRTRQDREIENNTQEIRNKGSIATETQMLSSQSATRNYTVTIASWANNGAVTSCTNWSPDPATVNIGQSFSQTATDCLQPQTRNRVESYVDHLSGSTVQVSSVTQSQSISATSTRTATGTKETWVATTAAYGAWTNTSGVYGCTNWSPAVSSVTIGQVFTQTATNCSVNQSRTRQDRQVETTTGAIRNNGAVVTETQTIGGQTGYQSATGTKQTWAYYPPVYGGWYNTSGVYGCSAWSPDPYTVNSGTAFTQTGTGCYINQNRSRQDRLYETTTGQVINNGAAVTEGQTVGGQVTYQTAYGTKPWTGCRFDGANYVNFFDGGGKTNPQWMVVVWDGVEIFRDIGTRVNYYPVVGGFTYYSGDGKTNTNHTVCRG
jgi:hypothetical protein